MQFILAAIVIALVGGLVFTVLSLVVLWAFEWDVDPPLSPEHCSQAIPAIPPTPINKAFAPVLDDPVVEDIILDKSELQEDDDRITPDRKARILRRMEDNQRKTDLELQIIK